MKLETAGLVPGLLALALCANAAEPERVRFVLTRNPAAQSCPGEGELTRRVAARIGRDPFSDAAEGAIEVRIARETARWRAEIRRVDRAGRPIATREPLESTAADCAALADAVVLAVALTIDPEAALGAAEPATTPPPLPAPPMPCPERSCPTPKLVVCPSCSPPPARADSPSLRAAARGVAAVGVLPAPAIGAGLSAELRPVSTWSFGLGVVYLPEIDSDDGDLSFGLTAAEPFACARALGTETASLWGCAGLQVGALHALSRGLRPVDPGDYPWIAATLGPRAELRLGGPLALELGASAAAPLIDHEFVVRGRPGSAHSPATIGFFAWLGLAIRAP